MSAGNAAEFIIEGDATKAVAAYHLLGATVKQFEADLKRQASAFKGVTHENIAALQGQAAQLIKLKQSYQEAASTVREMQRTQQNAASAEDAAMQRRIQQVQQWAKEAAEAERMVKQEAIQRHVASGTLEERVAARRTPGEVAMLSRHVKDASGNFAEGEKRGRGFSLMMTQLAYAASDAMSVTGGMAERIRAVSNNLQMAAMLIPGPWGIAANVLLLAGQAASELYRGMTDSAHAAHGSAAGADHMADSYAKLKKQIDEATMSQTEFNQRQREADTRKMIVEAGEQVEQARENLRSTKWWTGNELDSGMAGATQQVARMGKQTWDVVTGAPDEDTQVRMARNQLQNAQIKLDDLRKKAVEADQAALKKDRLRDAERAIGPARDEIASIFRDAGGGPAAAGRVQDAVTRALPSGMRDLAPDVSKEMMQRFQTDLEGDRLKDQLAPKTQEQRVAEETKLKAQEADRSLERERIKAEADGHIDHMEKSMIKALERIKRAADNTARQAEMDWEARRENDRRRLMQQPVPPVQPQVARNGNA